MVYTQIRVSARLSAQATNIKGKIHSLANLMLKSFRGYPLENLIVNSFLGYPLAIFMYTHLG